MSLFKNKQKSKDKEEDIVLKIGENGLNLIKSSEGLRLKAYKCSAGVWTIGYGHTGDVQQGDTIVKSEANELLLKDLKIFEKCVKDSVKVELSQNEYDALISFVYNIGCSAFKSSTLLKKLNNKDKEGAAQEFLRWNKVDGKSVLGLTRRRQKEKELFENAKNSN